MCTREPQQSTWLGLEVKVGVRVRGEGGRDRLLAHGGLTLALAMLRSASSSDAALFKARRASSSV